MKLSEFPQIFIIKPKLLLTRFEHFNKVLKCFLTPEGWYVYRKWRVQALALQRSAIASQ